MPRDGGTGVSESLSEQADRGLYCRQLGATDGRTDTALDVLLALVTGAGGGLCEGGFLWNLL